MPGRALDLTLAGSTVAVNNLLAACSGQATRPARSTADVAARFERRPDEATVFAEDIPNDLSDFTRSQNVDIWGNDLRSGMEDSQLRDISEVACARLCIGTQG